MEKREASYTLKAVHELHYNMSKLYATVSSEKATKYQGGNVKIAGHVTAEINGENVEVVRYGVAVNEQGEYDVFMRLWDGTEVTATVGKYNVK
jgi:hypothetical protein